MLVHRIHLLIELVLIDFDLLRCLGSDLLGFDFHLLDLKQGCSAFPLLIEVTALIGIVLGFLTSDITFKISKLIHQSFFLIWIESPFNPLFDGVLLLYEVLSLTRLAELFVNLVLNNCKLFRLLKVKLNLVSFDVILFSLVKLIIVAGEFVLELLCKLFLLVLDGLVDQT